MLRAARAARGSRQGERRLLRSVRQCRHRHRWNGVRAAVPRDVPFILDAKRGDIPSTAERYAAAAFDALDADAVTASPYLGPDSLEPLLDASRIASSTSSAARRIPASRVLQELRRRRRPTSGAPAEPLALPHRAHGRAAGSATRERSDWSSVRRDRRARGDPRDRSRPAVPGAGLGTQGGDAARRPCGTAGAGRRRQAAGRETGCWSTCRVASRAAALDADDPEAAIDAAARHWSERSGARITPAAR